MNKQELMEELFKDRCLIHNLLIDNAEYLEKEATDPSLSTWERQNCLDFAASRRKLAKKLDDFDNLVRAEVCHKCNTPYPVFLKPDNPCPFCNTTPEDDHDPWKALNEELFGPKEL